MFQLLTHYGAQIGTKADTYDALLAESHNEYQQAIQKYDAAITGADWAEANSGEADMWEECRGALH